MLASTSNEVGEHTTPARKQGIDSTSWDPKSIYYWV